MLNTFRDRIDALVFPIKWCHQRVVTLHEWIKLHFVALFPIKWYHQRVVTCFDPKSKYSTGIYRFPIKWCHQRVVTIEGYEVYCELIEVSN